jgi:hypothetical protein
MNNIKPSGHGGPIEVVIARWGHFFFFLVVGGLTSRGFFCPGFNDEDFGPQYRRPATVLHTISSVVGGFVTFGRVVGRRVVVGLVGAAVDGAGTTVELPPGTVDGVAIVATVEPDPLTVVPTIVELGAAGTDEEATGVTVVVVTADGGQGNSNHEGSVGDATSSGPHPGAAAPVNWNEADTRTWLARTAKGHLPGHGVYQLMLNETVPPAGTEAIV